MKYVLWGTGLYGEHCLEYMMRENIKVVALIDSNPQNSRGDCLKT